MLRYMSIQVMDNTLNDTTGTTSTAKKVGKQQTRAQMSQSKKRLWTKFVPGVYTFHELCDGVKENVND